MIKSTFWCFVTPSGIRQPTSKEGIKERHASKTYKFVLGDVQTPTEKFNFNHQRGFIQCPPSASLFYGQVMTFLYQRQICLNVSAWPLDRSLQTKQAYSDSCFNNVEPEYKKSRMEEIIERREKARERWEQKNYPTAKLRSFLKPPSLGSKVAIDVPAAKPAVGKVKTTKQVAARKFSEEHFNVSNVANDMANAAANWNKDTEKERLNTLGFFKWCLKTNGFQSMDRNTMAYLACSLPPL